MLHASTNVGESTALFHVLCTSASAACTPHRYEESPSIKVGLIVILLADLGTDKVISPIGGFSCDSLNEPLNTDYGVYVQYILWVLRTAMDCLLADARNGAPLAGWLLKAMILHGHLQRLRRSKVTRSTTYRASYSMSPISRTENVLLMNAGRVLFAPTV